MKEKIEPLAIERCYNFSSGWQWNWILNHWQLDVIILWVLVLQRVGDLLPVSQQVKKIPNHFTNVTILASCSIQIKLSLSSPSLVRWWWYIYNDEVSRVTFFSYFAFPLAKHPSILSFHGNCPLSLVRARAAFYYTFDYKPLHFQHIILIMMIDC